MSLISSFVLLTSFYSSSVRSLPTYCHSVSCLIDSSHFSIALKDAQYCAGEKKKHFIEKFVPCIFAFLLFFFSYLDGFPNTLLNIDIFSLSVKYC